MTPTTVFVLHVKRGYEDREEHIRRMMEKMGIEFEFLLGGDVDDLTPEVLDRYFAGEMREAKPATSCAMKHLLACEQIVERGLEGALVIEDDMVLYENFCRVFDECVQEMRREGIREALISFEDSALRFVPRSRRRRGKHLYIAERDRFTGCLYVTHSTAQRILDYVAEHGCDAPIDLFHKLLIARIGLRYYWCHPCIATQGTHNGMFPSSINAKSARKQRYRAWTWQFKLAYKKLIYLFR